ncbi:MAG: hypothetical protein A3H91_06740 [Gammaproteobacteria bacterium RIFCSPLOWO2_02_FULL_61_13]|nr:MAG: hypothetical protein A3H91_06740 [Gammaproteobacteria bacterium RIFCSPLOWO2_02_FULL_61_13]
MTEQLPLFPLQTVLFPGGRLPLKIFETRYIDLVSRCLRETAPFGVCLIRRGTEAGMTAEFFPMGTSARIVDWDQRADGLLGITVQGERRFRVLAGSADSNRQIWGEVEWCEEPPNATSLADQELAPLREFLERASGTLELPYETRESELRDPNWLSFRLAELLPDLGLRQALLQMDSGQERLAQLRTLLVATRTAA